MSDIISLLDEGRVDEIRRILSTVTPQEFRLIADKLWDEYFSVDVDVMIAILRRWVEIDPQNKESQHVLGSYLLSHGPDWDVEGRQLVGIDINDK